MPTCSHGPDCTIPWSMHDWSYEAAVEQTYRIVRFKQTGEPRVIKEGVSLEEAQEHCQRDDTHGDGWFDGYESE